MERGSVTTPFGRRPMTLGMLSSQITASRTQAGRSVDKWKLFRWLCEAKSLVGVSDRSLAVLNALLSFYPGTELSRESGLVVFPSNTQLSLRAHGMAGTTLRRHLAALIEAGLILRRDSPNGKRYARRNHSGAVGEAFGFDLSPLIARATEIETAAAELAAERQHMRIMRERLSLCRRDVAKLLELVHESAPQSDWQNYELQFEELIDQLPRKPSTAEIETVLGSMDRLRCDLTNQLENLLNFQKTDTYDHQNGCHIQNSHPDSLSESEVGLGKGREPLLRKAAGGDAAEALTEPPPKLATQNAASPPTAVDRSGTVPQRPCREIPLPAILQACPQIADYGPSGRISGWKDLMTAAIVVRSMLNVSADAYDEACSVLGCENAATIVACILERAEQIASPGGYLRELTRRAQRQEFSLGPMVVALSRAKRNGGVAVAS
ncbi:MULTISPECIES: plasmid replication protein RepC [unclassified Sinorhizobium]|uniref:plasmid replication protein RepC n=1 Tax=unclassified Sinorhizobium TaxID=2613772 RepID=UPI0024C27106|nr:MULTISPECIES: plasmid replication protein RepC [unclassified Sinorhizobium]MDK1377567.1 plasmid replication protein RepC [Sinorhizobium sp. 6-70]MDK1480117.1 plasmid replication protein RepC [Sinorhizobium sp. 6-117]